MDNLILAGGWLIITLSSFATGSILIKVFRKKKLSTVDRIYPLLLFGLVFLYIIAIVFTYSKEITSSDKIQILIQFGLVTVTSFYAWSAQQQAKANVIMAEEMQNQRYDLFRPVINIEVSQSSIAFENQKLFYANTTKGAGDLPNEILCVLHNVGVGPAIDIYSYFRVGDKENCEQRSIGTLSKDSKSDEKLLALQKQGTTNGLLLVIYIDAYGRYFASRREIYVAATGEPGLKLEVSPLEAFKLPKGEEQKAINEALKHVKSPTI